MAKKKQAVKETIRYIVKHRVFIISAIVLLSLALILFGAKFWLYFRFILGNDTVVTLEANKRNLYLVHGQNAELEFQAKVATNPFCRALCTYSFKDISAGTTIEEDSFILRSSSPLKKAYPIIPPGIGTGLELYRFDIDCYSAKTVFCSTAGEPSTRSILVTVNYDLTVEEKRLKENLAGSIKTLTHKASILNGMQKTLGDLAGELNKTVLFEDKSLETSQSISLLAEKLLYLQGIWDEEDYISLEASLQDLDLPDDMFKEAEGNLSSLLKSYNRIIDENENERNALENIARQPIADLTLSESIRELIDDFNSEALMLKQRTALAEKEALQQELSKKRLEVGLAVSELIKKKAIGLEIETSLDSDLLCNLTSNCISHTSIAELANASSFNLTEVCSKRQETVQAISSANSSSLMQDYPSDSGFWDDMDAKLDNMKRFYAAGYLLQLPKNSTNSRIIIDSLNRSFREAAPHPEYNLTSALIKALAEQKPVACNLTETTYPEIISPGLDRIELPEYPVIPLEVVFKPQTPRCCVFGKCTSCCMTQECRDDSASYPVVFIHGHAIDKETSAEYSLEGFNKIQDKLEEDGYLNAGFIALNTLKDEPPGLWGLPRAPITVRTTYYYDVLGDPENYMVIQTKSQNIDTYALRLRELIDTIKYKTGKPKVNIMAFSMGGLVSRRYLQVFGTDSVENVILIGTPNKGIEGSIADYCPIRGEKLECQDMDTKSLFMSKLNRGQFPNIPVYNIIGTGCRMDGRFGDGAVLEKNAYLEGANNFIINGTCEGLSKPLHLTLRDIDRYPEVYRIISGVLKGDANLSNISAST